MILQNIYERGSHLINLKEDGVISINTKDLIITQPTEENEKIKIPIEIEFNYEEEEEKGIVIKTKEEFEKIKTSILKCYYIYLYKKSETINIVTDNNKFYIFDTNSIPVDEIANLLVFRKPKKVLINIKEYKDLIKESSTNFWDLKFILKLLWNIEAENAKDISRYINMPFKAKKNAFVFSTNLIKLAKEINIYIEKNKINKYVLLENEILLQSVLLEKKGIPISVAKYNNFKKQLLAKFDKIMNDRQKYGQNFDYSKEEIIKYLSENQNILSLEQTILKIEQPKLAEEIRIYQNYEEMKKHTINNDRFIVSYDTYKDYQIDGNPLPNPYYYSNEGLYLVEGSYNDLYLRILAELSRDKNLIDATSNNKFIEHINLNILGNSKLGIFSEMFIKAYCKKAFEPEEIQEFIYAEYDTIISEKDIITITAIFKEKASKLFQFFLDFNGQDPEYSRYNTKIFTPDTNLDDYIKQIKNLIMKTAISYINSTLFEYQSKYRNSKDVHIELVAFMKNKIILASSEKSLSVATDILNRYMAISYKKYIKNTKYHNLTNVINYTAAQIE